jgi:hypothetical protein
MTHAAASQLSERCRHPRRTVGEKKCGAATSQAILDVVSSVRSQRPLAR